MDLNTIEESIKRLQEKSERAHFDTFQIASDGKNILKADIEAYEVLLKNLAVAREYEEYRHVNEAVINRFLELQDRVQHLDNVDVPANDGIEKATGAVTADAEPTQARTEVTPVIDMPDQEPERVPAVENPVTERVEEPVVASTLTGAVVNPKVEEPGAEHRVEPAAEPAKEELAVVEAPRAAEEPKPAEEPESGTRADALEEPIIEDKYAYRLNKDQIIQDLSEQTFKTSGMTPDQIRTSQDLINSVPLMDESKYVDPIQAEIDRLKNEYDNRSKAEPETSPNPAAEPYHAMTDEEIKKAQEKIGDPYNPMSDEEIEASRKKLGFDKPQAPSQTQAKPASEPNKPAEPVKPADKRSEKKKVVNRKKFNWKDRVSKKVAQLKGILFKENMKGRSQDYMNICQMIANFRVKYKNISVTDSNKGLEDIYNVISNSKGLAFEERKRLYRKLGRVAKAVERINRKKQSKALNDVDDLLSSLGAEPSRER